MVIDTSVLLALLLGEPGCEEYATAIAEDQVRLQSSVSLLEAGIVVLARKGEAGLRELDILVHSARIETVPFTGEQSRLAREAYARYGKGRHPAGLNLGDCCAYALHRESGEPLLFKGDDFARTDAEPALRR